MSLDFEEYTRCTETIGNESPLPAALVHRRALLAQFDLDQTTSLCDPLSFKCMTGFVLEGVFELALFGFLPLLLTIAAVWIIWYVFEKINPDVCDTHLRPWSVEHSRSTRRRSAINPARVNLVSEAVAYRVAACAEAARDYRRLVVSRLAPEASQV
jgi:hypothetical protein